MYYDEIKHEHIKHLNRVSNAQTKINQMTKEQIEEKLKFAKEHSCIIDLNDEDRTLIIEICKADAQKKISTMSIEQVNEMAKQLWRKYEKYHVGESEDELSIYEFYYLSKLKEKQSQDKKITVEKVAKNALKVTPADKCAEANNIESTPEHLKNGTSKND